MYTLLSQSRDGPEPAGRTPWRTAVRGALLAPLAWLLLACDDPVASPTTMLATLVSPNGAEGAALVELPVDGVSGVTAVQGQVLEVVRDGRRQVAIVLNAPGPISFRFTAADETRPPEVRVVQVSGPDDRPRALTGYGVTVAVAPPAPGAP